MAYTEATNTSWFSRLKGAFKGVILGGAIILIAFVLLFWNEGRAVKRAKTLQEGGGAVVNVDVQQHNPANEGKLIHVSGLATTVETLTDPEFGVSADAVKLIRQVEMYQWKESSKSETKKKLGGGEETVTTYHYDKEWAAYHTDSSSFKQPEGHRNPALPFNKRIFTANTVTLGAFTLPPFLVKKINSATPITVKKHKEKIANRTVHTTGTGFYLGNDPASPQIGDIRVSFLATFSTDVSVIAVQKSRTFDYFHSKAGGDLAILEQGIHPAQEMFASAQKSNTIMTWLIRFGGILLIYIGFHMVFAPLSVAADVIPVIGSLAGMGTSLIAILATLLFSSIIIGIAWLVYRPLIGGAFLLLAVLVLFFLFQKTRKKDGPPPLPQ